MNPIERLLAGDDDAADLQQVKQAGIFGSMGQRIAGAGKQVRRGAASVGQGALDATAGGIGVAAAAAAASGVVMGAEHIYNAATKSRDFKSMLAQNPDLAEHEDPKLVAQSFTTLRRFAPAFSRDPMVAGTYVRQIAQSPDQIGQFVEHAIGAHQKLPEQFRQTVLKGIEVGVRQGTPDSRYREARDQQVSNAALQRGNMNNQRIKQNLAQFEHDQSMQRMRHTDAQAIEHMRRPTGQADTADSEQVG